MSDTSVQKRCQKLKVVNVQFVPSSDAERRLIKVYVLLLRDNLKREEVNDEIT